MGDLGGGFAYDDADALMGQIAQWFPRLTHLHAWGVVGLREISALPQDLRVLDLRQCRALERLPGLPVGLETLDLDGCAALRSLPGGDALAALKYLHVDNCRQLPWKAETAVAGQTNLQKFLKSCCALREFTACGLDRIMGTLSLPESPLRKLVLAGCSRISAIEPGSTWDQLEHLNVNGCHALGCLPVPTGGAEPSAGQLQYLLTHDCPLLRHLGNPTEDQSDDNLRLDLRRVHRSRHEAQSTAAMLRAMMLLRMNPVNSYMAKLLFLGNGRCGKTTAANALRWLYMNPTERSENRGCNPSRYSGPTPDIAFDSVKMSFTDGGSVFPGTAHFWDFGGQEMYRNTHRIFAEAGSVFVIAVASEEEHQRRIQNDPKQTPIANPSEYEKENQYYLLSYWLDYIRSARKLMSIDDFGMAIADRDDPLGVVILYTGRPPKSGVSVQEYLIRQAGAYRKLIEDGRISHYHVDFGEETWEDRCGAFKRKVEQLLSGAADAYGIMLPKAFDTLREKCGKIVSDGKKETLDESGWESLVGESLDATNRERAGLVGEVSRGACEYLHECGIVFKVGSTVVVDQKKTILRMYQCIARMRSLLFGRYGMPLPGDQLWELLGKAMENVAGDGITEMADRVKLMQEMLEKCGYLQKAEYLEDWAVIHPELLPEEKGHIEDKANKAWRTVAAGGVGWRNDSLALVGLKSAILGAHDYRRVAAWIVKHGLYVGKRWGQAAGQIVGSAAEPPSDPRALQWIGWKDGFQMTIRAADGSTLGVVRMRWRPIPREKEESEDAGPEKDPRVVSLAGGILIEVLSQMPDNGAEWLAGVLAEANGPLAELRDHLDKIDPFSGSAHREPLRSSPRGAGQPSWRKFGVMARSRMDVAFSYRGIDSEVVDRICGILRRQVPGIGLVFYTDTSEERRDRVFLQEVYDDLRDADVLVVVASEKYFEQPNLETGANLYCPVELADAVREFHISCRRPAEKTIVLRADTPGGRVGSQNLDPAVKKVLNEFNKIVEGRFRSEDRAGVRLYELKVYDEIFRYRVSDTVIDDFCSKVCGSLLSNSRESDEDLAKRIRSALGWERGP